ncbi:hypothetical protein ACE5IS_07420 [Leptospira wolffii]|uniref:O-antigen ligase domain-containing protein n=1 Tax=Leptospira wolffii TaxID=409998 RepID=A0ABV5BLR9_9LEPT
MVFLFFSTAFLFFKTYGFPFSGALILCLTLALSQFHSARSLKPGVGFLFFPACLCVLSLWDGSSPEDILDLLCISLAGIVSGGGFSFLSNRSPAFKEAVGLLLLASSCILAYARRDFSPFLVPLMAVIVIPFFSKGFRMAVLGSFCVASLIWLFFTDASPVPEPSFYKSILLYLGLGWVLTRGRIDPASRLLFFVFFLLITVSHPGKEFALFSLGLFFSYLQEGTLGPESGSEI